MPFDPSTPPVSSDPSDTSGTIPAGEGPPRVLLAHPSGLSIPGYELIGEPIGRGATGEVFRARQAKLNRVVALKVIRPGHAGDHATLARFWAEAEAMAAVRHPHVVEVFELGEAGGAPFIAMEYLTGGSLSDCLRAGGRMGPREAAALVAKIARGVAAAHEEGIVHRDLKPANVLLDGHGEPKVADFGLAKRPAADMTSTEAYMGTPAYMAPEQAAGRAKFVGPPADVWALGIILYECLAGKRPFDGESGEEVRVKIIGEEPASVRSASSRVPRDLDTVVRKCLTKEASGRYPNAADLADDLDRFLEGRPVVARRVGPVGRFARWARRNPTVATLTAGVFAALAAGVAVSTWFAMSYARTAGQLDEALGEERKTAARLDKALGQERETAGRLEEALQVARRREGILAVERGLILCEKGDPKAGLLWLARGLDLMERTGADPEDVRHARLQVSLWGQAADPRRTDLPADWPLLADKQARARQVPPLSQVVNLLPDHASYLLPYETELRRFDIRTGRELARYPAGDDKTTPNKLSYFFEVAADGKAAATYYLPAAGDDEDRPRRLVLATRDLASGKVTGRAEIADPSSKVAVEWSPLLRYAAVTDTDPTLIQLWDVAAGRKVADVEMERAPYRWAVKFGPDDKTLVAWENGVSTTTSGGSTPLPPLLIDTATGKVLAKLPRKTAGEGLGPYIFSPDGGQLLFTREKAVRRWDARTGGGTRPARRRPHRVAEVHPRRPVAGRGWVRPLWNRGGRVPGLVLARPAAVGPPGGQPVPRFPGRVAGPAREPAG